MTIDPRDVSLWVVVICGSAGLAIFTAYFVVVVIRLMGQLLSKTQAHEVPAKMCPCKKKVFNSTILRVDATDDGPKTILKCNHCGTEHPE